jgi:hypothetical protein
LIFAGDNSSLKLIRIPVSFAVMLCPLSGWVKVLYKSPLSCIPYQVFRPCGKPLMNDALPT